MESWRYVSGVKNYVSETDGISRIKNGMTVGGLNPSRSFGTGSNWVLSSDQDGTRSQEVNVMQSSVANGSIRDIVLSGEFGFGRVHSQFPETLSSASGEEESSSKLSSSIVESNNSKDSSLIDLKLGRFTDHKDAQIKGNVKFSQAETSMPAKKARAGSSSSHQRPFCQVHGCRKDLSSSKDYHKRHKVCEIHSKTTKVIVKGIEQRFCQQCSRFHLLAEFDDGKRSCRKRLAGHNERRRKPHIGIHSGRAGRVFHSCTATSGSGSGTGTRLERTSSVLSSFVCQDILPGGSVLHPQRYEMNEWCESLKVEDGSDYYGPEIPSSKAQRHMRSSFGSDRQCYHKKYNAVMPIVCSSDFDSHAVFHNSAIGSEDFTTAVLDSLTATSSYGRALSLLSSPSQNSSIHSSGVPLITPSCNAHYSITQQVSQKLTRVSPQTSTTGVSSSSFPSSAETQMEPILISDGSDSVNYGIGGIIPGAEFLNPKNQLSCEDGSTIDLLQLSSRLQRVEQQRQYIKVKEDNDAFFGLRIT